MDLFGLIHYSCQTEGSIWFAYDADFNQLSMPIQRKTSRPSIDGKNTDHRRLTIDICQISVIDAHPYKKDLEAYRFEVCCQALCRVECTVGRTTSQDWLRMVLLSRSHARRRPQLWRLVSSETGVRRHKECLNWDHCNTPPGQTATGYAATTDCYIMERNDALYRQLQVWTECVYLLFFSDTRGLGGYLLFQNNV